jgi:hypothetical protein
MRDRNKDASRRDGAGDRTIAGRKADKRERARKVLAEGSPFHGALHSDPPQDPFRKLFSGSNLKFEF